MVERRGAAAGLWRFSLALYALPGVAPALIVLQDRGGFDVNLILYALWLGHSGRGRLDVGGLAAAERAVEKLRSEIVLPLRRLRRRVAADGEADLRRLRAAIAKLELAAERAVQRRLAAASGAARRAADGDARRADAHANFVRALGADAAASAEAGLVWRAFVEFADRAPPAHAPPPAGGAGSPQRLTVPLSRPKRSRMRPKV
jgi:uncharacterized protein (TIGR02444 family)